jgi:MFS family permease
MADFGTSSESLASFTLSTYLLGYCLGPLLVAPISELYGRVHILYFGFIGYLLSLVVCAKSTNIAEFIVFRTLMGFAGIIFLIGGRAVIADIISPQRRGLAVSFMTSGPTLVSGS